ncbi:hypothetical protein [Seonamhaeicola sp.]|uniref:hypothetical protein n=1 Tax=Seonamhaeicola sp. TaxID=1912245 RepID=UPI0026203CA1|nr:hypothetical protein [Seonamhaeicola sp.]
MEDQPTNLTDNNPTSDTQQTTASDKFYQSSRFWLAVVLIAIYLGFVIFLMKKVDLFELTKDTLKNSSDNLKWARYLFLFTGIEAIVFTAVGYVFGRDVSRKSEQKAEQRAEEEKNEKQKAQQEKDEVQKEAQKNKENLIKLQEAVIGEASKSNPNSFNLFKGYKAQVDADDGERADFTKSDSFIVESRAFELAKTLEAGFNSVTYVKMNYEVKASGFIKVVIDGKLQHSAKGYLPKVASTSSGIPVTVHWDGKGQWEFIASNIRNLETGNSMQMSPNPLKSNGNTSSFKVV